MSLATIPVYINADNIPNYEDFVRALVKPLPFAEHLTHMALGVAGESGELVDAIKRSAIYGKPLDRDNVIEELGDLAFYMQGLMSALDLDWHTVIQANGSKLVKRYPTGSYSNQQAVDRADKQEPEPAYKLEPTLRPNGAKLQYTLENWYQAGDVLYGEVFHHPSYPDGYKIQTSKIIQRQMHADMYFVETLNSIYRLGKPHPETSA